MKLKIKLNKRSKKMFSKLDTSEQKLVLNIFAKLQKKEFITSSAIAKLKKCKRGNFFRFSNAYFRIIFKRDLKNKTIEIYAILKKSGNQTYNQFDCPDE